MTSVPHPSATGAPVADAAAADLLYLYCIVEPGTEAHLLLQARAVAGMAPGEPLFPIVAHELVAAVSRVPAATFDQEPLNALVHDLSSIAPYAVRHEEAVHALLSAAPALVPAAFGAVYRGPQGVLDLLHRAGPHVRRLLVRLRGRREWTLKVYRDAAALSAAAEASSDELRRLAAEADAARPGRAYMLRRQRQRMLAMAARQLAARLLDAIMERLAEVSAAVRYDALPAGPPAGADLVLKAALLVDDVATERFRVAVAALNDAYAPRGLTLDLSGPWAPYSFLEDPGDGS